MANEREVMEQTAPERTASSNLESPSWDALLQQLNSGEDAKADAPWRAGLEAMDLSDSQTRVERQALSGQGQ